MGSINHTLSFEHVASHLYSLCLSLSLSLSLAPSLSHTQSTELKSHTRH
eukprot:COSAG05_NODE_15130_length_378_cov_0.526882_1_plen_48_part_01